MIIQNDFYYLRNGVLLTGCHFKRKIFLTTGKIFLDCCKWRVSPVVIVQNAS